MGMVDDDGRSVKKFAELKYNCSNWQKIYFWLD